MAYNMVAILRDTIKLTNVASQVSRRLVHLIGEIRWLINPPLMFYADAPSIVVPISSVPCNVFVPHHLRDLSVRAPNDIVG